MDLAQRDQRREFLGGSKFAEERRTVALDVGSRVVFGESKIERVASVGARESPLTSGESMDEPGKLAEM